jgi:hypothetical protein
MEALGGIQVSKITIKGTTKYRCRDILIKAGFRKHYFSCYEAVRYLIEHRHWTDGGVYTHLLIFKCKGKYRLISTNLNDGVYLGLFGSHVQWDPGTKAEVLARALRIINGG